MSVWFVEIITMQIEILGPCGCSSAFQIVLCRASPLVGQLAAFISGCLFLQVILVVQNLILFSLCNETEGIEWYDFI